MQLYALQDIINQKDGYPAQVAAAKQNFDRKPASLFGRIRDHLEILSGHLVRCSYCEDSCADEVEHVRPKDYYPAVTFHWENYLFACGPCNGGKRNKYPLIVDGQKIDLSQHRKQNGIVPPPDGIEMFIDPRTEEAMDHIWLDIIGGTFRFDPLNEDDQLSYDRADSTITILRLNREVLTRARKNAFTGYIDRLAQYARRKKEDGPDDELRSRQKDIAISPHRTVWLEIKRQKNLIPIAKVLFEEAPETLDL